MVMLYVYCSFTSFLRLQWRLSISVNSSNFSRNATSTQRRWNSPNDWGKPLGYYNSILLCAFRSVTNVTPAMEHHQGGGTKTVSMFSKLLDHSSKFVMEGVKNLVPKKHKLPVTKVAKTLRLTTISFQMVDQLIDTRQSVTTGLSGPSFDANEFCVFDPKLMHVSSKE